MRNNSKAKFALFALMAAFGLFAAAPAQADWYDGHRYHHGHIPHGYVWDPRLHYYVYAPPVVVAAPPPGAVVIAQPAPPPVIIAQPQPTYVEPAPVGLSVGVHIH